MFRLDRYSRRREWSTALWLKCHVMGWIRKRECGAAMRTPAARYMMMPIDSMLPAFTAHTGTGSDLMKL
ncbi:hypothetical protein D3C84_1189010 [compost metagenome]